MQVLFKYIVYYHKINLLALDKTWVFFYFHFPKSLLFQMPN